MKNVFLFLDAIIDRFIAVQMEYVLDMPINSIILMESLIEKVKKDI